MTTTRRRNVRSVGSREGAARVPLRPRALPRTRLPLAAHAAPRPGPGTPPSERRPGLARLAALVFRDPCCGVLVVVGLIVGLVTLGTRVASSGLFDRGWALAGLAGVLSAGLLAIGFFSRCGRRRGATCRRPGGPT